MACLRRCPCWLDPQFRTGEPEDMPGTHRTELDGYATEKPDCRHGLKPHPNLVDHGGPVAGFVCRVRRPGQSVGLITGLPASRPLFMSPRSPGPTLSEGRAGGSGDIIAPPRADSPLTLPRFGTK